jgi:hypothetical protein
MVDTSGANRIELECQVLSSALRCSWASEDGSGQAKSCLELAQLFPDLVTPFEPHQSQQPRNNYELLDIACEVSPRKVIIAYFRLAKKFLRENNPRQKRVEYFQLLDAGFILRKPRLRLSHDLVVSRAKLLEKKLIQANGTFEMREVVDPVPTPAAEIAEAVADGVSTAPDVLSTPVPTPTQLTAPTPTQSTAPTPTQSTAPTPATVPAMSSTPGSPVSPKPVPAQAAPQRLPAVIELLRSARLIEDSEVQALTNQMRSFPGVSVVELILSAGYVTESEMKSVQLGEFLLGQGKINLGQFCVAMYDERSSGVKMAESLQTRGWLKPD